jgi:histidinol-phosphate aminotransferase
LQEKGYQVSAKEGNFIFIKPKHVDAGTIVKRMKDEKKILIKVYNDVPNLGDCLRVSIGESEVMDTFIKALEDIDK